MATSGGDMNHIKLLLGAVSIAAFGFGAGYYCAADSTREQGQSTPVATAASANIEQQLAAAIDEIGRLQKGSAAANTATPALPVSRPETYAALLEKLDKLPETFIEAQLEKYLGRESLENITDTRAFSKRLLEVALKDQDDPPKEDSPQHVDIQFSKSPVYGKQMLTQDVALFSYEPLFAHIVSAEPVGEVIVKWQDVQTGEILIFKKMSIGPGGESYITAIPGAGWRNSLYRVSLSSVDDSVQLMGSNVYSISEVYAQDGRKPNAEVIQDLVSMGRAVPKKK
jgi:hypothetical protein